MGLPIRPWKVVVLGNSGVGKTSLLNRYINDDFSLYIRATSGVDMLTKDVTIEGSIITLQIWDTAGQERFSPLSPSYLRDASCAVFVYDVNCGSSLEGVRRWYKDLDDQDNPMPIPKILIGNKTDVEDSREVPFTEGEQFAQDYNMMALIECSAKTGAGVNRAFEILLRKVLEEQRVRQASMPRQAAVDPGVIKLKPDGQARRGWWRRFRRCIMNF